MGRKMRQEVSTAISDTVLIRLIFPVPSYHRNAMGAQIEIEGQKKGGKFWGEIISVFWRSPT